MAVLNEIRKRSVVLILVIALALFSFVIGNDIFTKSSFFSGATDIVAPINGKDIKTSEFQEMVKNYQDQSNNSQSNIEAMNVIYNQEVRRLVLSTEFEELGLEVGKDEMRDLLKKGLASFTEFQDANGNFDFARLNAFIANLKDLKGESAPLGSLMVNYDSWTKNEEAIANNTLQQSYFTLIKAGLNANIEDAEDAYLKDAQTAEVKFVQIPYSSIPNSKIKVSKSEIKDYIKQHEDKYKTDANTKIAYVLFEEKASNTDEKLIKQSMINLKKDVVEYNQITKSSDTIVGFDNTDDIETFVNSNSDIKFNPNYFRTSELPLALRDSVTKLSKNQYFGPYKEGEFFILSKLLDAKQMPDSVKVRHILIPFIGGQRADASVKKSPEQAKVTADSILTEIKTGRAKFTDLLYLSSDKASNEKNGEIEFAYNSGMAPEFKDFSFSKSKGAIELVPTSFGYHVIEILEQKMFNQAYKFANMAKKIEPSQQTLDSVFNTMSKFEIAAKEKGLRAVAKQRKFKVNIQNFNELDENIPGMGSQREIVRWTFDDATEVGDFKTFNIMGIGYAIVKLEERNQEGLMTPEAATPLVEPILINQKKAKIIKEQIKSNSLEKVATSQKQPVRSVNNATLGNTILSGVGSEPKVVGTIFGLKQGKTSKLIEGEFGVYLVKLIKLNKAPKLDNYTAFINRLNNEIKPTAPMKVFNALEEAAEIEDNRAKTVY